MTLVVVEDSTVYTSLTVSFMKITAKTVLVQKNQLNLAGGVRSDVQLAGDHIVFSHNKVVALIDRAVELTPSTSLLLEDNQVDRENILELMFPEHKLDSINILRSALGVAQERLKKNFIKAKVSSLKIEGCYLQIDNEGVFVVESDNFILKNNHLVNMATSAFEVKVYESFQALNNTFDHCKKKAFFDISPMMNVTQMMMINNTFLNPEDGFLKLSPAFELNMDNLAINNLSIYKPCSCDLPHNMITDIKTEQKSLSMSLVNKTSNKSQLDLERVLFQSIWCIDRKSNELTNLISLSSCLSLHRTNLPNGDAGEATKAREATEATEASEAAEATKPPQATDQDLTWVLGLFLGLLILAIIGLCIFFAIRSRLILEILLSLHSSFNQAEEVREVQVTWRPEDDTELQGGPNKNAISGKTEYPKDPRKLTSPMAVCDEYSYSPIFVHPNIFVFVFVLFFFKPNIFVFVFALFLSTQI